MKYVKLSIVALSLALASCSGAADKIKTENANVAGGGEESATQVVSTQESAAFEFEKEFHDFGELTEGEVVNTMFEFTNTGEVPLVITSANGSCGCTVPDYPRTPIAPGDKGTIKVSFNSQGRSGKNDKTVTIEANTVPRTTVLKITSNVMPKAKS